MAYCELVWGTKTRGYVLLAKKLDVPKQDLILTAGVWTIDMSSVDDDVGFARILTSSAHSFGPADGRSFRMSFHI